MRRLTAGVIAFGLLVGGLLVGYHRGTIAAQAQPPANYLQIEECQIGAGGVVNNLIAEMSKYVADYRKTGEYKSVRLFVHSYGPSLSLYTIYEPKSWAAIPAGFDKMVKANPTVMTQPFPCAGHSDNILTEVIVK